MDISQLYPGRGTDSEHFLFELNCPGDLHLHWSAVLLLENLCGYFPFGLSHFCNKKKTENPNRYCYHCWYMTYMLIWYIISILCLAWRLLLPIPLLLAVAFFSTAQGLFPFLRGTGSTTTWGFGSPNFQTCAGTFWKAQIVSYYLRYLCQIYATFWANEFKWGYLHHSQIPFPLKCALKQTFWTCSPGKLCLSRSKILGINMYQCFNTPLILICCQGCNTVGVVLTFQTFSPGITLACPSSFSIWEAGTILLLLHRTWELGAVGEPQKRSTGIITLPLQQFLGSNKTNSPQGSVQIDKKNDLSRTKGFPSTGCC